MITVPPIVRDLALLLGRVGLGIVLIGHGLQKVTGDGGLGSVAKGFEGMGVPAPGISAYFTAGVELVGGAALILGAVVPVAGVLVALVMGGAFVFVHSGNGLFVDKGGFEFVLVIGVLALVLAVTGSGKFGVDHLFTGRTRERADATA